MTFGSALARLRGDQQAERERKQAEAARAPVEDDDDDEYEAPANAVASAVETEDETAEYEAPPSRVFGGVPASQPEPTIEEIDLDALEVLAIVPGDYQGVSKGGKHKFVGQIDGAMGIGYLADGGNLGEDILIILARG